MARVNIEDSIWTDPRFKALTRALGSEEMAIGCLVIAWRSAQTFFKINGVGIPTPTFMHLMGAQNMIDLGLAIIREDFVYLLGSNDQFSWLLDRVECGRRGGVASGIAKREIIEENSKQNESKPKQTPSKPNPLTLPLTLSLKENTNTEETVVFEKSSDKGNKTEDLLQEWSTTLQHFGVTRPIAAIDKRTIFSLVRQHGPEMTMRAIIGMRFEAKSDSFDPSKHVSISRLLDVARFEKMLNLGSKKNISKLSEIELSPEDEKKRKEKSLARKVAIFNGTRT